MFVNVSQSHGNVAICLALLIPLIILKVTPCVRPLVLYYDYELETDKAETNVPKYTIGN